MAVAFKRVLPVTINAPDVSMSIDLAGLAAGDTIFGAFAVVGLTTGGTWSAALNSSFDDPNIGNFGGYGGGHTFYAVYNGTDLNYQIGLTDLGTKFNPTGVSLACAACAYSGSTGPGELAAEHLFSSTRYPSSTASAGPVSEDDAGELIVAAQVLPNDQPALGTVSSPFVIRATSVGGPWTHNAADGRGMVAPTMYAQVQLADCGSSTLAPTDVTWTNTETACTTIEGVPIEGVGVALWVLDLGAPLSTGLHVWQRV